MKATLHTTNTVRAGRWLGRAWRGYARKESRAIQRLAAKGLPASVCRVLFWIAKTVVFGVLLYTAFWLVLLLLLFAVALAWATRISDRDEPEEWVIGEQVEHKNNPGYDPILYNDAPDPRYYDPRYDNDEHR